MSDMAVSRISVRIDTNLRRRLKEEASRNGKKESDVVREALEAYFASRRKPETCYDVALRMGIIGMIKNAPRDLSTNPKYFKGFGK